MVEFKVGDIVRVKALEDFPCLEGGSFEVTDEMRSFCGHVARVTSVLGGWFYLLSLDDGAAAWSADLLEPRVYDLAEAMFLPGASVLPRPLRSAVSSAAVDWRSMYINFCQSTLGALLHETHPIMSPREAATTARAYACELVMQLQKEFEEHGRFFCD